MLSEFFKSILCSENRKSTLEEGYQCPKSEELSRYGLSLSEVMMNMKSSL